MLLWNPLLLAFDVGFQFSIAATLGLILATPIVDKWITFVRNGFLREIIATTIAAQLFVLPLLLYHTGNLSLFALPANVLVLPVVPFAMLFAFIAGLAGILTPLIAPALGIPAYILLAYVVAVGEWGAALPFAHVIIPAFPFAVVVLLYFLLWRLLSRYAAR
jgi:competence protein ComEC